MWFPSHYLQHLRFPRLILRLPVCSRTHYLQYLRFPRHTGRGSRPIIYSTCGSRALSRACPCVLASIIYNTCGSSATRDVVPVDNFIKRSTIAMVAKGARAPRQLKTRRVRTKTSKFHPNPPLDPRGANFNHHSCPTESDRHGLLVKTPALYAPNAAISVATWRGTGDYARHVFNYLIKRDAILKSTGNLKGHLIKIWQSH